MQQRNFLLPNEACICLNLTEAAMRSINSPDVSFHSKERFPVPDHHGIQLVSAAIVSFPFHLRSRLHMWGANHLLFWGGIFAHPLILCLDVPPIVSQIHCCCVCRKEWVVKWDLTFAFIVLSTEIFSNTS